jgi:NADPH2:quinone reductase
MESPMRAVVLNRFGPPSELVPEKLPDPVPGPGQVVVAVEAVSITFVETQIRAGHPPHPSMSPELPVILGNGVGGVVAAVGPAVDARLTGRRVVTTTGGSGGYAERVAVRADDLIDVPAELLVADATALLADGRTALALMDAAAIRAGETVLVEAAAGGVGSLLVQLARSAGATVVAAAGGARKLAVAAELGAGILADYTAADWADCIRDQVGHVDVVFDGVGGAVGLAAFGLLRAGGRCCTFGMASGEFARISAEAAKGQRIRLLRGVQVSPEGMRELTRRALADGASGALRPVIGQTFPLEAAADAHAAIEARVTVGKTLLLV